MVKGTFLFFVATTRYLTSSAFIFVLMALACPEIRAAEGAVEPVSETKPPPRKLPRYELGIGGGSFYVPDYPGADESRYRGLMLPFFIYRGDVWRADQEGGLRGRFINRERLKFDLSFNAAFNAHSNHNDARRGMPDLDWIGEVGPRVLYHIVKSPKHGLDFSFPIRHVFSVGVKSWDIHANARGFTVNPEVTYKRNGLIDRTIMGRVTVGGTWATEKLMDYFYQVDPQYALAHRPPYDAKAGYLSTDVTLSLIKFFPKQNVAAFAGVNWSFYNDAENRRSPLLRDRETAAYAVGFVWSVLQSKELIAED